jgi:hypothetical protein
MKNDEEVYIDGELYLYSEYYNRLDALTHTDRGYTWTQKEGVPSIRCPMCHGDKFMIRIPKGYASIKLYCGCGQVLKMDG